MALIGLASAAVLAISGCGSKTAYTAHQRPPSVVNVTAAITDHGVLLSPTKLGAGPVHLLVTNQSTDSRELTVQSTSGNAGPKDVSSGPINPQGTAEVNVDLREGGYRVSASGAGPAATLTVTGSRSSSQNEVLEP
jgi:hypothetical protein